MTGSNLVDHAFVVEARCTSGAGAIRVYDPVICLGRPTAPSPPPASNPGSTIVTAAKMAKTVSADITAAALDIAAEFGTAGEVGHRSSSPTDQRTSWP